VPVVQKADLIVTYISLPLRYARTLDRYLDDVSRQSGCSTGSHKHLTACICIT